MYRFLASTRWLGWLLLVCIFAAACVGLGKWQMNRLDEARAANDLVKANYDAPALDFQQARPFFSTLPEDRAWTPVDMKGSYLPEDTRIVRNRTTNGQPGYEVLVPFQTDEGTRVIIDRGWLPIGDDSAGRPDVIPAPPKGQVDITARLKVGEPAVRRSAPKGQVASIELPALEEDLGYPIATGAYGVIADEKPSPATAPTALERPSIDEGNHLSYSLQWFAFGVLSFIGLGYAARQQARLNREDAQEAAEAAAAGTDVVHSAYRAPRQRTHRRKGNEPTDEELEDAYLDRFEDQAHH
ncbi:MULTISPECIES: SURF1 family cytochrome oxidase biogenesis protein [Micrococcaceae]|uniref:SURF1-like protein n=1 Tax=Arthrobacter rhombi TaxID=71253 RepID=A0A1R4GWA3_9MICC|nr:MULTISPECIES: SURF1 family protein [Micrococcaceae]PCC26952.1 SURF1 family protein [Glutamicibacter sp. BW78]SJM72375.1 Cytochrome oxidase biogenesis protein Surf1, facilitates heme A insertion [Arthrobacter rhombi]